MKKLEFQGISLVRLCVDERLADVLLSNPLGFDQTISSSNGETFIDLSIHLTDELIHWIQCMGSDIEVIHPPGLRELIRNMLEKTIHKYRLV